MTDVTTLFFDVGGVLLTNGWDRHSRRAVIDGCGLDWEEFEDRHQFVSAEFELGKLTLDQYLERTVFYRQRRFSAEHFFALMKSQSQPMPDSLRLLGQVSGSGRYLLATLNNESRELNDYRIDRFGLRHHFSAFLSSCYLGVKKPEPEIFGLALDVTGTRPEQALFIDDRPLNLECAVRAGMKTIEFVDADQLRRSLRACGIETGKDPT